jgi:hypothetical protein
MIALICASVLNEQCRKTIICDGWQKKNYRPIYTTIKEMKRDLIHREKPQKMAKIFTPA